MPYEWPCEDDLRSRLHALAGRRAAPEVHGNILTWQGVTYRFASLQYADRKNFTNGEGARINGGRFTPIGGPRTVWDSLGRFRQEMGLTRSDFARLVGLSDRSAASWEAGAELKDSSLRTITEVGRMYAKLRKSFPTPEQLAGWLKAPNPAFSGSQPLQVIERGEIDRIWRMIYFLESGTPG